MNLDLRARAALARLELAADVFGFNPHQRRGPDGRWIRMPTSELKRPRAPRKPRKPATGAAAPRAAIDRTELPPINLPDLEGNYRDQRAVYNEDVLFFAEGRQLDNQQNGKTDRELDLWIKDVNEALGDPALITPSGQTKRDKLVDGLRSWLNVQYRGDDLLDPAPEDAGSRPVPTLPPGPRTAGGPRPPEDAPHAQRRDALNNSIRSGLVGQQLLGDGAMGDTRRIQLADGTETVYKRAHQAFGSSNRPWYPKDQADAEELAALVADALHVNAPAVSRVSETEIYQELVPGATAGSRGWRQPPVDLAHTPEGQRFGLLDVVLDNSDRHAGNWMVDGTDIYAIDHGLAFRQNRTGISKASNSRFSTESWIGVNGDPLGDNPLSDSDAAYLRQRVEALRPRFEALGRGDWLNGALERLNQLGQRAGSVTDLYPAHLRR